MAIYKGGKSQFALHEAANKENLQLRSEEWDNGEMIASRPDKHTVKGLEAVLRVFGEPTPISGAGIAAGKQSRKKND